MNSRPAATEAAAVPSERRARVEGSLLRDYWELTKPEISFLVTISALAGFTLGTGSSVDWLLLTATLGGVGLTAAGVGMINHYLERDLDAKMRRTAQRPLPAGRIPANHALYGGLFLVAAGVAILCPLANPLTAILAGLTAVLYLFVYTPMKQTSTLNTLVGTIPGALPALGGYTAVTGTIDWVGMSAFGVLAAWQMPHFLSLAWMYRNDYARANYVMLPVAEPSGRSTGWQTTLYTLLMIAIGIAPYALGVSGLLYLLGTLPLGLWFALRAFRFQRTLTNQDARSVLKASIVYIPVWVALLVADHLLLG